MTRIRIGVIGLKFGHYHVQTLANMPEFELVSVASREADYPGGVDEYAARYGVRPYTDGMEMLAHEQLEAVSLCISPRRREPLLVHASKHNIALFVEKPWAASLAQAQQFDSFCRDNSAPVMVGFSFRFHPALVKLRELIDTQLGMPLASSGEYVFDWLPDPNHWLWDPQNGGGFFNENSCHLFDSICHLLGEPISVTAEANIVHGSPSPEIAVINLRFENGAIAAIMVGGLGASALSTFPRINILTVHGQAVLHGHEHMWTGLTYAVRGNPAANHLDIHPEVLGATRYSAAFQHFAACIREKISPSASVMHGIRSVAIAQAIYESALSGRKVHL